MRPERIRRKTDSCPFRLKSSPCKLVFLTLWRKEEESLLSASMNIIHELVLLSQIVVIDVSLAGDNAVAVGMAASGLPVAQRHLAIVRGIIAAAILRVLFAVFAVQLLHIVGLLAVGGLLLLWVAWKMYEEIHHAKLMHEHKSSQPSGAEADSDSSQSQPIPPVLVQKKLSAAIVQIAVADISMSLDNVLAVAGVARDHIFALVAGLFLSVLLMGMAAAFVARLITSHRWVAWIGLVIVLFTAMRMIWEGSLDVMSRT